MFIYEWYMEYLTDKNYSQKENFVNSNYIRRKVHPGGLDVVGELENWGGTWDLGEILESENWGGEEEFEVFKDEIVVVVVIGLISLFEWWDEEDIESSWCFFGEVNLET